MTMTIYMTISMTISMTIHYIRITFFHFFPKYTRRLWRVAFAFIDRRSHVWTVEAAPVPDDYLYIYVCMYIRL